MKFLFIPFICSKSACSTREIYKLYADATYIAFIYFFNISVQLNAVKKLIDYDFYMILIKNDAKWIRIICFNWIIRNLGIRCIPIVNIKMVNDELSLF